MPALSPVHKALLDDLTARMKQVKEDASIDDGDPHSAVLDAQMAVCEATIGAASAIQQSCDGVAALHLREFNAIKASVAALRGTKRQGIRQTTMMGIIAGCLMASICLNIALIRRGAAAGKEAAASCEPDVGPDGATSWRCGTTWRLLPGGSR